MLNIPLTLNLADYHYHFMFKKQFMTKMNQVLGQPMLITENITKTQINIATALNVLSNNTL